MVIGGILSLIGAATLAGTAATASVVTAIVATGTVTTAAVTTETATIAATEATAAGSDDCRSQTPRS